jgi:hypothetical protein
VNLARLPFRILAARSTKRMKALKPQVDAINARYKSRPGGLQMDPEHSREISELYREHRINPMGGRGEAGVDGGEPTVRGAAVPGRAGSPPQAYSLPRRLTACPTVFNGSKIIVHGTEPAGPGVLDSAEPTAAASRRSRPQRVDVVLGDEQSADAGTAVVADEALRLTALSPALSSSFSW